MFKYIFSHLHFTFRDSLVFWLFREAYTSIDLTFIISPSEEKFLLNKKRACCIFCVFGFAVARYFQHIDLDSKIQLNRQNHGNTKFKQKLKSRIINYELSNSSKSRNEQLEREPGVIRLCTRCSPWPGYGPEYPMWTIPNNCVLRNMLTILKYCVVQTTQQHMRASRASHVLARFSSFFLSHRVQIVSSVIYFTL